MTGKVIIVTGANAGIGYEVARILCEGGNDVILACRSEERANHSIERIKKQNPSALATYMQLDMASLESVRKFVDDFHATGKKLSVLINNAGVALNMKDTKRQYTSDNFELTMGTNHLGHFLLTHLLLDDLKKTAATEGSDARIVVVSSSMHDTEFAKKRGNVQPLDVDNFLLAREGTYSGLQAYKNSKLANILFTYELSRQLEGSGVKVNAVCPGFVPTTELLRSATGATKFFCRYVLHGIFRFTKSTRTVQQAATCITALALDEAFKDASGKYFRDGVESKSSEESMDEAKRLKVWEISARYTHLEGYEPLDAPPPPVEPEIKKEEAAPIESNGDAVKPVENGEEPAKPAEETAPEQTAVAVGDENSEKQDTVPEEPDKKDDGGDDSEKKDGGEVILPADTKPSQVEGEVIN